MSQVLIFTLACFALAQAGSWLDRSPFPRWNRPGGRVPHLPEPPSHGAPHERCRDQVRAPGTPAERAVVRKGWKLYGASRIFGNSVVFTAMSDTDGMCRPLGYQAFVYSEGRYAGTLSPVPMNSRQDGALTRIHLTSPTRIIAEFARYAPSDPLCCPSRKVHVLYTLRNDEIPHLEASGVTSEPGP
jgi:hypothetical protein